MDAVDREIRTLAAIRSPGTPVVSVHLDTTWSDEHQRSRVRLFVADAIRREQAGRPGDAGLEGTLELVREHVGGLTRQAFDEGAGGVALFACEPLGLLRAISVQHAFSPMRFEVLPGPDVLPLVQLRGRFPPAAVALVDAHGGRILETELGEVTGEGRVEGEAHRRHSMGGWAQKRYQRHIRQQIRRNHDEVAALLEGLLDAEPRQLFALAGPDRVLADFQRVLPARVAGRVFWTLPNPRERSDREAMVRDDLLQGLFAALRTRTRIDAERDVDVVMGHAAAGGPACAGAEEVALAVAEGRVHRLLLHEGVEILGRECSACGAVGARALPACAYCGGETRAVPLGLELARRVLLAQGDVEVVEASPRLARHGGIAALLRRGAAAELGAP